MLKGNPANYYFFEFFFYILAAVKIILFIIPLLLVCISLTAQTDPYDQLKEQYFSLFDESNNDYKKALSIAKEMNAWALKNESDTSLRYASSLQYIGVCFHYLQELDSAKTFYQLAQEILKFQNREDHSSNTACLINLGILYSDMGDYKSAEPYYKQALEITKKTLGEEHLDVASSLNNLGVLYSDMGDYKSAEPYFKQALEIRKKTLGEEHPDYANGLNNLGNLYSDMGDYKAAEPLSKQALEIRKKTLGEEHPDYAGSLVNLGNLYHDMGYYEVAEDYYKRYIDIIKRVLGEEHIEYARGCNGLGNLYVSMNKLKEAEYYLLKNVEIKKKFFGENHTSYATSLSNLGRLYYSIGDFKATLLYMKKCFEIFQKVLDEQHPYMNTIKENLGRLYVDMGDYETALEFYNESFEKTKKNLGENNLAYAQLLQQIGYVHQEMGSFKAAEGYYKQASRIIKKLLGEESIYYAYNLGYLIDLYLDMQNYLDVEPLIDQHKSIFKGVGDDDFFDIDNTLAYCYTLLGRHKEAYAILKKNFSINSKQIADDFEWLSDNQKEHYWKGNVYYYDMLSEFASESYDIVPEAVALNYNGTIFTKSKLLETKISKENYYIEVDEIREKLRYCNKLLYKLESDGSDKRDLMDKLRHEADSLDKQLELSWPAYAEQKRNLLITWEKVQENMDQGEAAIEFVRFQVNEDSAFQYQALIIRKDLELPVLAPLCDESKLTGLDPRIDFGEYYTLVWEPIEKHLKGIHTIYYAPVGELNNVPFHSFLVPREKEGHRYLMDKYTLHQLTSTRYLALGLKAKQKEKFDTSISIVGGVNYDYLPGTSNDEKINSNIIETREIGSKIKVRYLPGTKKEANAVQTILSRNEWETSFLEGENATEENLTKFSDKNSKGIMHIATHGYVFPEYSSMDTTIKENSIRYSYRYNNNPMVRSGLVLAGGNWALMGSDTLTQMGAPENGILTALEVSLLNLRNTKLVVLSACETGLGKIEGAEGSFGLKRGFKLAGVEQMIVSLWSVPDKETMELMTLFYSDLVQSMDPVYSFQKAQNQMRQKYPISPEKWAGFVLVR